MLEKFARLAGLGAYGACAGLLAAFGGVIWLAAPTGTAGMDSISSAVTIISVGGVIAALIVAHIAIARQLIRLSQGAEKRHEL